ncbi:MAG: rhomboid family intramembrane serine protease, partial [Proteobacteria bacterium]|nr:rhomboid family intramembrane serine protease [Pseudomonadota bacterium]
MPPITLILILLNVLVYVLELVTGPEIIRIFALWPPGSDGTFHLWQLVTYSFLHGSLTHLGFNMFAVWMFGAELERRWNDLRYLLTYLLSVVVAAMTQIAVSGYFLHS